MIHGQSLAATRYPDGLPGLLTIKEFSVLLGKSRPTAMRILSDYPDYVVDRGGSRMVAVGLYQKLTRDESVTYES